MAASPQTALFDDAVNENLDPGRRHYCATAGVAVEIAAEVPADIVGLRSAVGVLTVIFAGKKAVDTGAEGPAEGDRMNVAVSNTHSDKAVASHLLADLLGAAHLQKPEEDRLHRLLLVNSACCACCEAPFLLSVAGCLCSCPARPSSWWNWSSHSSKTTQAGGVSADII